MLHGIVSSIKVSNSSLIKTESFATRDEKKMSQVSIFIYFVSRTRIFGDENEPAMMMKELNLFDEGKR